MNNQKFFRCCSEKESGGVILEKYSFSKVVNADVVLLPVLDSEDVIFLRNEPVFFTEVPFGAGDGCHWFVMFYDGFRCGVQQVRDKVFLGYYVAMA